MHHKGLRYSALMAEIDNSELHWYLWATSDAQTHAVRVVQSKLAKDLGVSKMKLHRAIVALEEDGSLTALPKAGGSAPVSYVVTEPG